MKFKLTRFPRRLTDVALYAAIADIGGTVEASREPARLRLAKAAVMFETAILGDLSG